MRLLQSNIPRQYVFINQGVKIMSELVSDYWLRYDANTLNTQIYVRSAGVWHLVNELPIEKAVYLSDMLRNEKPVFYIPGSKILHTKEEPPGEGE
jgi:hypothetical protein